MNEWISVKDRIPEKVGRYLVCTENIAGYRLLENPVFIAESFHGQWVFEGWESNRVTHWMSLPSIEGLHDENT